MYETLAAYYDMFTDDASCAQWRDAFTRLIGTRRKGMDVGCGTGRLTIELKKLGYDVMGCDVSSQMLNVAAIKAREAGLSIKFALMDANRLIGSGLDFITAANDVVNYMSDPSRFFMRAAEALAPGGILVFDISTEYKLTSILGNNTFTDTEKDVTYIWENTLSPRRKRLDMRLTFFEDDGNNHYVRRTEEQTQYVHCAADIEEKLKKAGFAKIKTYGFPRLTRPSKTDERAIFAASVR